MSATYFEEFQKVLQRSQQSAPKQLSKKRWRHRPHFKDEDSDTSSTSSSSSKSEYSFRILRFMVDWNCPNDDVSPLNLVPTVRWEILSRPQAVWEPIHINTKILPPISSAEYKRMENNEDIYVSGDYEISPPYSSKTASPFRLSVQRGTLSDRDIIHEKFMTPSGSKIQERLRLLEGSPVLKSLRPLNIGLKVPALFENSDGRSVTIPASRFPDLFFMHESIQKHNVELELTTHEHVIKQDAFRAFSAFIEDLFPNARLEQSRMRQSGQVSFDYLWALFPPTQILYERRSIPFCDEFSEQCLQVLSIEKSSTYSDGVPVWHLTLQDVVYRPGHGIGPCLVTTHRYIRPFPGIKSITDECIGLVPLDMIPRGERESLIARLSDVGRRYITICSQPWTIWEYEGPVLFPHATFGRQLREEYTMSDDNKPWQRYTRERIIVDATVSQAAYQVKVDDDGWVDEFLDQKKSHEEALTLETDNNFENLQLRATRPEELYLICRSQAPAFLLDSNSHAIGILVSLLKAPVWGSIQKTAALSQRANNHRDIHMWKSIIEDFVLPKHRGLAKHRGRSIRCPGLVLLFQGPQRMTRQITTSIAEDLQKPLVMMQTPSWRKLDHVVFHNVLRWEGILLVEDDRIFSEILYEEFENHPGVVFLTSDEPELIPERCHLAIDAVIDCSIPSGASLEEQISDSRFLWYYYLDDNLPELVEATPNERLQRIADILASVESRETRMANILLTAKRLAQSNGEAVKEGHIFEVIRQALAPKDLSEFESQLEKLDKRVEHVSGF